MAYLNRRFTKEHMQMAKCKKGMCDTISHPANATITHPREWLKLNS